MLAIMLMHLPILFIPAILIAIQTGLMREEEDKMIRTGLPYDFDLMETIEKEGAVVDVSQVCYPNMDEIERTTLIYLRNTNYENIELDFSKVGFDSKKRFLIEYLTGDIEHPVKELTNTWFSLFFHYNGFPITLPSILSEEEEKQFYNECPSIINELTCFAYSLALYPISRLDTEGFTFDFSDIESTDFKFNLNICELISHPCWNLIYEKNPAYPPKFYKQLFTEDNNILFETIMKFTPFSVLLYGMNDREQWREFANIIKQYMENAQ